MSATSDNKSANKQSTNGNIWKDIDPKFHAIKTKEDELRNMYSLKSSDPKRPDINNTVHGLVELTPEKVIELRSEMIEAFELNMTNRNTQLRKSFSGKPCVGNGFFVSSRTKECFIFHRGLEIMDGLPSDLKPYVCLAGGHVLDYIRVASANDVDLFIVGTNEPEVIIHKLLSYLTKDVDKKPIHVVRTTNSITLNCPVITKGRYDYRTTIQVQIILRSYTSVSEVVTGFDLDPSGVCYYQGTFYGTERAVYSLKNMRINVDLDRMSLSYNYRLIKYTKKKGFSIFIPVTITTNYFDEVLRHVSRNVHYSSKDMRTMFNDSLIGLLVFENLIFRQSRGLSTIETSDYDETKYRKSDTSSTKNITKTLLQTSKEIGQKLGWTQMSKDDDIYKYYHLIISEGLIVGTRMLMRKQDDIELIIEDNGLSNIDADNCGISSRITFITNNPGTQFTGSFHPIKTDWKRWLRILPGPPQSNKRFKNKSLISEPIMRPECKYVSYTWN